MLPFPPCAGNLVDRYIWTVHTCLAARGWVQDAPQVEPLKNIHGVVSTGADPREYADPSNPGLIKHTYWDTAVCIVVLRTVLAQAYLNGLPFILYAFGWTNGISMAEPCFIYFISSALFGSIALHLFHASHITELSPAEFKSGMDWGEAQLRESVNYIDKFPIYFCLTGGLSHQIEHHLFPTVSLVFAEDIAPIVRETAEEFGLPYNCEPSPLAAVRKSIEYVATLANVPHTLNGASG